MPNTLLSVSKSNKLRIPFVQGKFNMGGTGVLQFCGNQNLQFVLTKRFPGANATDGLTDMSKDYWGFTIVRRENPKNGKRSSVYTYLAPEGKVLRFKADELNLLPHKEEPYKDPMQWGTFIKLYNYNIPKYSTIINFNLFYRLSILIADAALPIRLIETRDYKGHTKETTVSGIKTRLSDSNSDNLEEGFPYSSEISVEGQKMPISIYAFKKGNDSNYRKDEGILFTINGQTHGNISKQFFKRSKVKMDYISDSILILVDCNNLDGRSKEDLFMNSRDRLREGSLRSIIEKGLGELISTHAGLKALVEKRRRETLENKISNDKPLVDVLKDIIKKSPTLTSLLLKGMRISAPFDYTGSAYDKRYAGKYFPTFFRIINKSKNQTLVKQVEVNHKFRVQFETDAVNDYFSRDKEKGTFILTVDGKEVTNCSYNLVNGTFSLNIEVPKGSKKGDTYSYNFKVINESVVEVFEEEFKVIIIKEKAKKPPTDGPKKPPEDGQNKNDKNKVTFKFDIPNVQDVTKEQWDDPFYNFEKTSALKVVSNGEEGYDFYLNIDNIHLNTELKNIKDHDEIEFLKAKYRYGMVLIGISIINALNDLSSEEDDQGEEVRNDISKQVYDITKMLSPILIPMINSLGSLGEDD